MAYEIDFRNIGLLARFLKFYLGKFTILQQGFRDTTLRLCLLITCRLATEERFCLGLARQAVLKDYVNYSCPFVLKMYLYYRLPALVRPVNAWLNCQKNGNGLGFKRE